MTSTGEAPATSELALAYNGDNYKITPQNLVDSVSTSTYGASLYIWNLTFTQGQSVSYQTWINNPASPKQPYDITKGNLYFNVVHAYNNWDLSLTMIPSPTNLAAVLDGAIIAQTGSSGQAVKAFVYNGYLYVFHDWTGSIYPQSKPLPFLQF